MITWYTDSELEIYFDIIPLVMVRYVKPDDDVNLKSEILKKPFISKKELNVLLVDNIDTKRYEFCVIKNYCWDGATIPRFFWRLIGSKTDSRFLIPSLIHDILCENHSYVDNDRYFSTRVFERLLYVSGVNPFNRWLMFHSVDNFQKFCSWRK